MPVYEAKKKTRPEEASIEKSFKKEKTYPGSC